jgi:hypothetical protein
MTHQDQDPMDDRGPTPDPRHDAARLGLVVIGEAAALQSGDEEALDASEQNIRETVDELVDEPLTRRQEEVVERLASAGGSIAAGLSGALAAETGREPGEVLEGAARSFVWQDRFVDEPGDRDDTRGHQDGRQRDDARGHDDARGRGTDDGTA